MTGRAAPVAGGVRVDAGAPSAPLLELRDLRVAFGHGDRRVVAVDGLSYSVAAGTTLALIGESGSGKTVSSRAVLGLLPPSATVTGRSASTARSSSASPRRRCAGTAGPAWRWSSRTPRAR